ncbi:Cu+-exporting ATPase [Nocardioides albertanoniae]|uniref:Cu+-exporting ATPase n=1 Tax=Nocardioides albertanoniae TaxID=1175486 RepID=A0A543A2L5_9ACTN|nr:HAD family hydrolase [Nocardioides albertanoniae]TQL66811.1 Cu+-exporting ATPase [Nocardioides albertanoniae]
MTAALVVLGAGAAMAYVLGSWFPRIVAGWVGRGHGIESVPAPAWATAAKVGTVVLDRWGTVTTGKLRVTTVDPLEPDHLRNLRWFAGALEHEAEGRLARAIARISPRGKVTAFEQVPGCGVRGSVDRHPVRVGRPGWVGMAERNDLGVVVGVELDERPLGYLVVGDDIRKDATASVSRLTALGVTPVLVSDDTARNTEHLAQSCGIERCHPEIAPEKRARLVAELQEQGQVVAFATSRAEDAEAQAVADLGVGGGGGVRLQDLDAGRIATLLSTARGVVAGSRLARVLALVPAVVGLALVLLGLGSVLIAAVCAVAALVTAAVVGAIVVVRSQNLSRT